MNFDYFGEENKLTRKSFNLDEVLDFCKTHRVEVLMMEDYQYGCFINAKPGDGCYATGLTPVYTMMCGIREYIKHKENGKRHRLPFRVGKRQKRAVLDADGLEVVIFPKGAECLAEEYVKFKNGKVD